VSDWIYLSLLDGPSITALKGRVDAGHAQLVAGIADTLPVGIWVARAPSGDLLYANGAFAEIMGMPALHDVVAGGYSGPYGIFTRDGKPYPEERLPFARVLKARDAVTVDDLSIWRKDGSKVAVRAFAKPLFNDEREIASVAVVFFDVTAEVNAGRAQVDAQELLRLVVNNAPIILHATDRSGLVTVSAGRGLASIGHKPGELVGRSVHDLYRGEPAVLTNRERVLAGEELRIKSRVGEFTLESCLVPMRAPSGEIDGVIGVTTNVTEAERMQAQLLEADRMTAIGTLTASVAHEVATPLSYVGAGLAHLTRELAAGPPALQDLLRELTRGVERVKTIARDLSSLSRPGEHREPIDVHGVLESVIRMTAHETLRRARVTRGYQPIPRVSANEARLTQVFLNLVLNAAQAIPEGTPAEQEIRVTTRERGGRAVVEIEDTGVGIPPELLPRIFEPFFSGKPAGQGTGLGLWISRNIVNALGGSVAVESRPGCTRFTVDLPACGEAERAPAQSPVEPVSGRPRVLIVDDDLSLRRVLRTTLGSDCDLDLAESGTQALELLRKGTYDVVLCDLMMPDMTGVQVFERIATTRPDLEPKLFFMTGGALTASAREFVARVPHRCFEKPFDFWTVISAIVRDLRAA
jgi:two-component system cell cycle sensor histidine kinase/response regulator CckA